MQFRFVSPSLKSRLYSSRHFSILWVWALAGLVVMAWALTLAMPKAERTLYSDQATHAMIAASVWNDGDLKYSLNDLRRFRADYPKEPGPTGLFLKQGAAGDWFYAKPYIYGLVAAPFYAAFGMDGFIVFNVVCLISIGAVVGLALRQAVGVRWGIFSSLAFVVPSAFLPWVFVAHPDLFIAALLAVGGYLLLNGKSSRRSQIIAAVILGASLHEKIPFLVVIPFVVWAMPAVGWGRRTLIGLIVVLSWFLFSSMNLAIDGSLLAYQGLRLYAHGAPFPLEDGWTPPTMGITGHVFDASAVVLSIVGNLSLLPEKFFDFLLGRQTGIVPYFAFAFVLLILRPVFDWVRSALVLLGFFAYLVLQWLVFPTNGYGGTGSYGSRYMMQALPLIPLSYVGASAKSVFTSWGTTSRVFKIFLCVATFSAVLFQHRIFLQGHESVMRFYLANIAPPLNAFRLEKWLLPTTFSGASSQYVETKEKGRFRIYKPDETDRDSWSRIGGDSRNPSFVLYKDDDGSKFPPLALLSPVEAKVRISSGGRVVWRGALVAAQPQTLELDGLIHFRSAFDLLLMKRVAWADLVLEPELATAQGHEQWPATSLRFDTSPPRYEGVGERLTPAQLVARGAELRRGWSHIEPWGVWSDGDIADISLRVGEGGRKFLVELGAHAYVPTGRVALEVEFRCSGGSPHRVPFEQGKFKSVNLACEKLPHHEYLVVTAAVRNPTSPQAEGRGTDHRRLGVGLNTFKIERIE